MRESLQVLLCEDLKVLDDRGQITVFPYFLIVFNRLYVLQ